ncbi:WGR domain-containing protein [Thiohalocapsa marina]|uniref:WGR domain-containing protein n=1 Tax=Thiohalocapsa marina TaxID=424902 RepID=UPI0036DB2852
MVARLRMPVVSQQGQRWINAEKARYYRVVLEQDLFGDWSLIACWGALHSRRGGMRVTALPSLDAGVAALDGIAKRRRQRGYVPVHPPPDPSA